MKRTFASKLREKMIADGATDEEIEHILRKHRQYCKENNEYIGELLKEEKRYRYSCVNETENATMVEYDKHDEF